MVGSSKILTVSYGTFSCTLEGFDDSFSTMKAIAEYFRDLAADDRYFGAEPPTPDAEMLARIAEREVSRRVEARLDDSGIVLKTGSALAAVGAAQAPAVEEETEDAQDFVAEAVDPVGIDDETESDDAGIAPVAEDTPVMPPVAEAPVQPAPAMFAPADLTPTDDYDDEDEAPILSADLAAPTAQPVEPAPIHLDADSVAAKLQRIRAVVGRGTPAVTGVDDGSEAPQSLFVQPQDTEIEDIAKGAAAEIETPTEAVTAEAETEEQETIEATAEADDLDAATLGILNDALAAEQEIPVTDEVDEVAETVSEFEDDDQFETDDDDAEALTGFNPDPGSDMDNAVDDADPAADEDNDDDAFGVMGEIEGPAEDSETDEAEETPAPVRARVIRMRRSAVDAAAAAGGLLAQDDENDNAIADLQDKLAEDADLDLYGEDGVEDDGALETEDDLGLSAEAEAEAMDIADLVRMDGDAPVEPEATIEATDEETAPADLSSLSADDEAELQAELAALVGGMETEADAIVTEETLSIEAIDELVEDTPAGALSEAVAEVDVDVDDMVADLAEDLDEDYLEADLSLSDQDEDGDNEDNLQAELDEDAAAEEAPEEQAVAGPARPRRVRLPGSIDEDDGSMDRIMSQTEAQMQAPETSRRSEAISQLKAAVAATEADREIAKGSDAHDEDNAEETFRDDLAQVVRPTRPIRPQRPTERAERTERPAPAPLKLVASQRVDLPTAEAGSEEAPRGPVVPVRPRRVMKTEEPAATLSEEGNDGTASSGFAAFAEEMGAQDLSDLLEAAAAYTAFVEGSEDFSRPQLMNKIKETSDQEYSREEGLRSFGTLLRQGRIMKVRNGRFQVSDETRFNPQRRAG